MRRLRHWTTGVVAQLDGIVSRIENHEAVAESTLREARRAAARARVRLGLVRRDGDALRERLATARESEACWRERAARLAERDENAALECLRRRRAAQREVASLQARLAEHERAERGLADDVARVEERVQKLDARHHRLATRQSCADAVAVNPEPEVDEVFERWELHVAERELVRGDAPPADAFASELDREEAEAALRAELEALRAAPREEDPS